MGEVLEIKAMDGTSSITKICSKCKQEKSIDEFYIFKAGKFGRYSWCKPCASADRSAYQRNNRPKIKLVDKRRYLREKYDLTLEEYQELYGSQEGKCAICKQVDSRGHLLCVDHDHKTNVRRGLICHNCNRCLGFANDNPEILRLMAEYIEEHRVLAAIFNRPLTF
jgi:hypothetical protein